jgi:hypothetical protein
LEEETLIQGGNKQLLGGRKQLVKKENDPVVGGNSWLGEETIAS